MAKIQTCNFFVDKVYAHRIMCNLNEDKFIRDL